MALVVTQISVTIYFIIFLLYSENIFPLFCPLNVRNMKTDPLTPSNMDCTLYMDICAHMQTHAYTYCLITVMQDIEQKHKTSKKYIIDCHNIMMEQFTWFFFWNTSSIMRTAIYRAHSWKHTHRECLILCLILGPLNLFKRNNIVYYNLNFINL